MHTLEHSNYYIKLLEAGSTFRPIQGNYESKASALTSTKSFIRSRKMYLQHYYVILCYYSHATSSWRVTKMNPQTTPWRPKQEPIWTNKRLIAPLFYLAEGLGVEKGSARSSHRIKKLIVVYAGRRPEAPSINAEKLAPLSKGGSIGPGQTARAIAS